MALKLKNLEHLDGKRVSQSTLTSQYPEVFVNRKKNTGEWIVTTDTDPIYGMHHIYLGGEHIAGGYGFATTKTRDDLCYIQETYNGVFDYFNQAYAYHNNAYHWLRQYAIDSYAYTLFAINENTFKNTFVNSSYNQISTNDTTYTFLFRNGEMFIYPEYDELTLGFDNMYISTLDKNLINGDETTTLLYKQIRLYPSIDNLGNNNEYIEPGSIKIEVKTLSNTESDNLKLKNFRTKNCQVDISEYITNIINVGLENYKEYVDVDVPYNIDLIFYISYSKTKFNQQLNTHITEYINSKPIHIKWIDPIYYTIVHKSFLFDDKNNIITDPEKLLLCFSDENIHNTDYTDEFLFDFTQQDNYTMIHDCKPLENGHINQQMEYYNSNNYYILYAIPKSILDSFPTFDFYMNIDVKVMGHRPGGFAKIPINITHTHKFEEAKMVDYIYFYSNPQFFTKNIRIDLHK